MSAPTTKTEPKRNPPERVPYSKPPFTIGDIKKAIPPHCFKRSLLRSFAYLVHDMTFVSLFYYIATTFFHLLPSPYNYLAWPVYWFFQGCLVLSSIPHLWSPTSRGSTAPAATTPNTASLEHDEVFVPKPKSKIEWYYKYLSNPPGRAITLMITLALGWPLYLAINASGRQYDRFACHYDPYSPIYNARERLPIYISDVGVFVTTYLLYRVALAKGLAWLICIYGLPLLILNGFTVFITYLQHTHPSLPHYDSSEWDWLRGALATVDRDYGVLNNVFHNITNTHVPHHLFSAMPHYHAVEATEAMKPILGEYYHFDGTPVYKAMWREARECLYVEPDDGSKGVFWYNNKF
ncbi:unnamed protein product [Coffea canephora]|uniref:Fatty acid desaturase domain-containing protein n=1 Tax=Coffea canephora TaxID=49390 RepID=A0A068UTV9_COFCA|nr:unnamed protein product [Coffea canephora]